MPCTPSSTYNPADFSEIHPASESPTKVGWYATNHSDTGNIFKAHESGEDIYNLLHYWDGTHWNFYSHLSIVCFGEVGCQCIFIGLGKWFGFKKEHHE